MTTYEMKLYKFYIIASLIVTALFLGVVLAHASDKCQDPSKLSPKMKKAYYQLKKAEKEAGFKVSIKCTPSKKVGAK